MKPASTKTTAEPMRENQNCAGTDTSEEPGRTPQIVGHDHRLTVARHEGVDHPEDSSDRHRSEEFERVAACREGFQLRRRAAMKPTLDVTERRHDTDNNPRLTHNGTRLIRQRDRRWE